MISRLSQLIVGWLRLLVSMSLDRSLDRSLARSIGRFLGSVLEVLGLKNLAECTSQRVKWTSGARDMIIVHACTIIIVHEFMSDDVGWGGRAYTRTCMYYACMIIVHACTIIIVHACTMIIVHACTMYYDHSTCMYYDHSTCKS